MAERNYLKTEAVFLAEKSPKKEVVVTPPLREDSLKVTENGTYQAPIGRGYTDVDVNVETNNVVYVDLTMDEIDPSVYTSEETLEEIYEMLLNNKEVRVRFNLDGYDTWEYEAQIIVWGTGVVSTEPLTEGIFLQTQTVNGHDVISLSALDTNDSREWNLDVETIPDPHTPYLLSVTLEWDADDVYIADTTIDNIYTHASEYGADWVQFIVPVHATTRVYNIRGVNYGTANINNVEKLYCQFWLFDGSRMIIFKCVGNQETTWEYKIYS